MMKYLLLLTALSCIWANAYADQSYILNFRLTQNDKVLNQGKANIGNKSKIWSYGLKRSYLKLTCKPLASGKVEKALSTEDLFNGLQVTHNITDGVVSLTVKKNIVQPRQVEIHALAKNECKDLAPKVTIISESYTLPVSDSNKVSYPFGADMIFCVRLKK